MAVQLVWFKKDLRTVDHRPLAAAAEVGAVLCVYVLEPEQLQAEDADDRHWRFLRQSLAQLDGRLRQLGSRLVLLLGQLPFVFSWLHSACGIARIWCHEETGNFTSYQRDRRVRAWCRAVGVPIREIPQTGVVRRLVSRDGWSGIWRERMREPITAEPRRLVCGAAAVCGSSDSSLPPELQPGPAWDLTAGQTQEADSAFQQGGWEAAERCLD
ncbi:MAG: hypothetical protein RLZZ436_2975 [Planctomycetota bacterium]